MQNQNGDPSALLLLVSAYLTAKEAVITSGFASEVDWQHDLCLAALSESYFLREAAWVVLSAGMKESVIRRKFPEITTAFLDWRDARSIVRRRKRCKRIAMEAFSNERKISAILDIAAEVDVQGFEFVKHSLSNNPTEYIRTLPFMGPATTFHLAKNLGISVVKPDRHLIRVAKKVGYSSPVELCQAIAQFVGDKVAVIDLVIWRYATLNRDYLSLFPALDFRLTHDSAIHSVVGTIRKKGTASGTTFSPSYYRPLPV